MKEDCLKKDLPCFSAIDYTNIVSSLESLLQENIKKINDISSFSVTHTWNSVMQPLGDMNDQLNQFWSPISHLNATINSPELRKVYQACLPKLSDYHTQISHNDVLYRAIKQMHDDESFQQLDESQQKAIKNELRDFKLSGVALSAKNKQVFARLSKKLSTLSNQFEENVLDATQAWSKHISDQSSLKGLPDYALAAAQHAARSRKLSGWLLTLEAPCYIAVMTHADDRELRRELYVAFNTRASDQGPNASEWDNSPIMDQILSARRELAQLLGFKNYAEYSLATKMVQKPQQVIDFLEELKKYTLAKAKQDIQELQRFAAEHLQLTELQAWDIAYASEKLRSTRYTISQQDLMPYFPESQVVSGLFTVVKRLFGLQCEQVQHAEVWHPDVRCYALFDRGHQLRGYFYLDLYARENKRGGAWMDDMRSRRRNAAGKLQLPIAFITCNLNPPVAERPALFTHTDVETLFHEFGHALQHLLTTVDYSEVSGINGIPWDAVELPSQFLENWVWQKESLDMIARHYQTGESLPDALYQRMLAAKNFQAAMQMMRQIEFALFDMRLHIEFDPNQKGHLALILDQVRQAVSVFPTPSFNRFPNSFSHIFAGGYAAGYYSYKWAEVMAADAFALFEEKGIFDQHSAQLFQRYILEPGGSVDPATLYQSYRGRAPTINALLQRDGIL